MEQQETKKGTAYFRELSLRFHREGVEHGAPNNVSCPSSKTENVLEPFLKAAG